MTKIKRFSSIAQILEHKNANKQHNIHITYNFYKHTLTKNTQVRHSHSYVHFLLRVYMYIYYI